MAACAALLATGCGPKRVQTPEPAAGRQAVVVLLPDPDTGVVGRIAVSNPAGKVDLDAARESTTASAKRPPSPPVVMTEAEVRRLFGDALSALPPAPKHFTLNFRFESDELTDESAALVPEILKAVKERPFADVSVVGHTDTTGTPATNFGLGLKRANAVRAILIKAGLDASFIDVVSHGEAEPLVRTRNGVLEPRNRRVEITVR